MEEIFVWVGLGLCIAAILVGIRQIRQICREHSATAAEIEHRRQVWMREFEEIHSSSRSALRSKASASDFRVVIKADYE